MITDQKAVSSLLNAKRHIQAQRLRLHNQPPSFQPTQILSAIHYQLSKHQPTIQRLLQEQPAHKKAPVLPILPLENISVLKKEKQESKKMSVSVKNKEMKIYSMHDRSLVNENNLAVATPVSTMRASRRRPNSFQRKSRRGESLHEQMNSSLLLQARQLEQRALKTKSVYRLIYTKQGLVENQQLLMFRKLYSNYWAKIKKTLSVIQQFTKKYNLEAHARSEVIVELAIRQDNPSVQRILNCLVEKDAIIKQNPYVPFIFQGPNGKVQAANFIKRNWLGSRSRQAYKVSLRLKQAVICIQRWWRKILEYRHNRNLRREHAEKIQVQFEQRQAQFWTQFRPIQASEHTEVHIWSTSRGELDRLTTEHLEQRRNVHFNRLFRVKHPGRKVIMVCVEGLPGQTQRYYEKMLDLGMTPQLQNKVTFVRLDYQKFPCHFSAYSLLRYSVKAQSRIKSLIKGRHAYIVPGEPCNEIVLLSHSLGIPVLMGDPQLGYLLTLKSQSKRLFKEAGLPLTVGSIEIYDEGELISTLAVLSVKFPHVEEWILKIQDSFEGRGIASFNVGKIIAIKKILMKSKVQTSLIRAETQESELSHFSGIGDEQLVARVREVITEKLPLRLRFYYPQLYKSYRQFLLGFLSRGGVIEAKRPNSKTLLANFFLGPEGLIEQFFCCQRLSENNKPVACTYPQRQVKKGYIESLSRQLAESLALKKQVGYFSLKLLIFWRDGALDCEAMGLSCGLNAMNSSFEQFDFLLDGMEEEDRYMVRQKTSSSTRRGTQAFEYKILKEEMVEKKPRYFIYVPYLYSELYCQDIPSFFKEANLRKITFDVQHNLGTAFMLLDSLQSNMLGLMLCRESEEGLGEELQKVVQWLQEQQSRQHKKSGILFTECIALRELAQLSKHLKA